MDQSPWGTIARTTGVCGLVGVLLVFGPVIAISTLGEPPFDGTSEEVADFFGAAGDAGWYQVAEATFAVGMLALLWFFVGLTALLRRAEGQPGWRSTGALLSGTLLVAYGNVDSSWEAAAFRGSDTDPAVALFAFDTGNLGFANAWLAMASFAVATGWVLMETGVLPRWAAWWAVATGVGLFLARFVWESAAWYLPYFAFWAGVVTFAVRLLRQGRLPVVPDVTERTQAERTQGERKQG
jgi:hypothetical protein